MQTSGENVRTVSISLIITICLLWLAFPADVANGATRPWWGINSGLETDSIADKVQDLGVKWVRLTIDWHRVESKRGRFNWEVPDAEIQRAAQRGLYVYAILYGTPRWANGGRAPKHPPKSSQEWARFVSMVANRYKNQPAVKGYGLWNEPNLTKFWSGTRSDYIRKILIPGYRSIKSTGKRLIVGAPEITHHWPLQQGWNLDEFMSEAKPYFDVFTVHYYSDAPYAFELFMDQLVKPYRSGKKVWVTEVGSKACNRVRCSEARQSHAYFQYLKVQRKRAKWFKKIFPYRIWDPQDQCNKNGNGFGLTYGVNLTERPAFRTYRDFILRKTYRDPDTTCR